MTLALAALSAFALSAAVFSLGAVRWMSSVHAADLARIAGAHEREVRILKQMCADAVSRQESAHAAELSRMDAFWTRFDEKSDRMMERLEAEWAERSEQEDVVSKADELWAQSPESALPPDDDLDWSS